jgi:LysM repeat protein
MAHVSHAKRRVTPPVKRRKYGKRTFILVMGILLLAAVIATTAGNIFARGGSTTPHPTAAPTVTQLHTDQPRPVLVHPSPVPKAVHVITAQARAYVVRAGDCLSAIAQHFHLPSWQALYHMNHHVVGSNPNLIYAGQVLRL